MIEQERPRIDPTMAWNLAYVQRINREVADFLFPERSFSSMTMKLYEELGEVVRDPNDPAEVADAIIMLLDHMDRIGGNAGIEILSKLQTNLERSWIKKDSGVFQHG